MARNETPVWGVVLTCIGMIVCRGTSGADVWTDPRPIHALHGAGDILVAATSGGVVLFDLSGMRAHTVTTTQRLPSHVVRDVAIANRADRVFAATDNGLARGWFEGTWSAVEARNDEEGRAWSTCLSGPAGAFLAGGDRGALLGWRGSRVDSLRVPTRTGRVVGLDVAPGYFDVRRREVGRAARVASSPVFPVGLVVATDNDGVWFLRDTGSDPRWLRVGERDGLPSRYVRDVAVDAQGFVWVATHAGLARLGPGVRVTTFANDSLLAGRIEVLLKGADGALYASIGDGIARLDTASPEVHAERVLTVSRPVVALAWALDTLWWSAGDTLHALSGASRILPSQLAAGTGMALGSSSDTTWVGHPFGRASRYAAGGWTRLGSEHGLPHADVRSFLRRGARLYAGTASGLYVDDPALTPSHAPRFERVSGAPNDVAAQVSWLGAHWVGGTEGLWRHAGDSRHDGDAWQPVSLWSGASEVTALAVARDTLWASAGYGGIACHDGVRWGRPPVVAHLAGAYWGALAVSATGGIAFGTSSGVAVWRAGIVRKADAAPDVFIRDVVWWNNIVVAGEPRGAWLHMPDRRWRRLGVLDGLPGARVRALAVDRDALWVATTRGVGRFLPSDFALACASSTCTVRARQLAPAMPSSFARGVHVVRGTRAALATLEDVRFEHAHRLHLYDARGRRVRVLRRHAVDGFEWDARDATGRVLPSGVYFARLDDWRDGRAAPPADARTTLRIVLVR